MKNLILAVIVVLVLGGLILTAVLFVGGTGPQPSDPVQPGRPESPALVPVVGAGPLAPEAEREVLTTPDEVPGAVSLAAADPPSYTAALSGLYGRILEADGKPVPGMAVELLELEFDFLTVSLERLAAEDVAPPTSLSVGSARTDEAGVFRIPGARPVGFHALAIDPGGPRATARVVDVAFRTGEDADLGDIVLDPYCTFLGRVVDEQGKPVSGARVRATTLSRVLILDGLQNVRADTFAVVSAGRREPVVINVPPRFQMLESRLPIPTTFSGSDGSFRLEGVPQGLASIAVDLRGTAGNVVGPRPTGRRPETDLGDVLVRAGRVGGGRVVDADGNGVPGCTVVLAAELSVAVVALGEAVVCGPDGGFAVPGLLPSGVVHAAVRLDASQPWTVSGPYEDPTRIELVLDASHRARLHFADADGRAVPGVSVSLRALPRNDAGDFAMFESPRRLRQEAQEIEPGTVELTRLSPGDYQLVASADGFAHATARFAVPTDGPVEVTMARATTITLRLLDAETEEPVAGAHAGLVSGQRRSEMLETARKRTDGDGVVVFDRAPLGEVEGVVRIDHPAYPPDMVKLEAEAFQAGQVVHWRKGGALHGFLRDAGRAHAEPKCLVLTSNDWSDRSPNEEIPRFVVPDLATGEFSVNRLSAGPWAYEVYDRFLAGDPLKIGPELIPSGPHQILRGDFEIEEGKTTELELDTDPALRGAVCEIRGRIHSNLPLDTVYRVSVDDEPRTMQEVRSGDTFEFRELLPEQHTLIVHSGDFESGGPALWASQILLSPQERREVAVEIEAAEASFRVVDSAGNPVAGIEVQIQPMRFEGNEPMGWRLNGRAKSDEEGYARAAVARAGHYAVHARHPEFGVAHAEVDLPMESLLLRLDPGVPCAGTIATTRKDFQFVSLNIQGLDDPLSAEWVSLSAGETKFQVTGLRPGRYKADFYVWGDGSQDQGSVEFVLPPGGDEHLKLELR